MRWTSCLLALFVAVTAPATADGPVDLPPAADLLFSGVLAGDSEILLARAGGGEPVNLSRHEGGDNWPVWSPDGRRILFQSRRSGNLDIWLMEADGSGQRQLTHHPEPDYLPAWSAAGDSALFTSWRVEGDEERAPHFHIMGLDGGGQRRLPIPSPRSSEGLFATPDGSLLVFSRKEGDGADLYLATIDGLRETRLTRDAAKGIYHGSPAVSPDGRWIACYSATDSSSALTVLAVDGSSRNTLAVSGHDWYPHWSADGAWLLYTAPAYGGDGTDLDLFAVPVAGGEPVLVRGGPARDQEGSWRPSSMRHP